MRKAVLHQSNPRVDGSKYARMMSLFRRIVPGIEANITMSIMLEKEHKRQEAVKKNHCAQVINSIVRHVL